MSTFLAGRLRQGVTMDFIERIFGVSPDGGDGSFELLLFLIPVTLMFAIVCWRKKRHATVKRGLPP